jgi:hypothetical protein
MSSFSPYLTRPIIIAFAGGLLSIIMVAYVLGFISPDSESTHPVGTSTDTEVHVHGDFKLYIGDERIRFTDPKYQSTPEHTHHVSLHFHDGNDEVIHRHADNVTLSDFFSSLDMSLTNECLTLSNGEDYCTNETETLMLLINGERTLNVTEYIINEEDRILVYYGNPTNPNLTEYITSVTEMACMYSGTCPEKGTPPTESCGLTCEVADIARSESTSIWNHLTTFVNGW